MPKSAGITPFSPNTQTAKPGVENGCEKPRFLGFPKFRFFYFLVKFYTDRI